MVRRQERPRPGDEFLVATGPCQARSAWAARFLASLLGPGPVLWWVTEWGVWPSSENAHLFAALRLAGGETRPLDEVPGHLFGASETGALVSYLQVALLSGWGGVALGLDGGSRLILSHDEWAMLRVADGAASPREELARHGLLRGHGVAAQGTFAILGLNEDGTSLPPEFTPEPA